MQKKIKKFGLVLTLVSVLALCFVITSSATSYSTYDYDDIEYNVITSTVTSEFGRVSPSNTNIFYRTGVYFSNAPSNYYTFEFLYVERFITWLQDNNLTDYNDFISYVELNESGNLFKNLKYMTYGQFDFIYNFPHSSTLFDEGLIQGYQQGLTVGTEQGYQQGLTVGTEQGYQQGLTVGTEQGYLQGYDEGEAFGYQNGLTVGRDEGYNEGYNVGMKDADAVERGIMSIVGAPMYVLTSVFNVQIFGINLLNIITTIMTLIVIAWVIKKLAN